MDARLRSDVISPVQFFHEQIYVAMHETNDYVGLCNLLMSDELTQYEKRSLAEQYYYRLPKMNLTTLNYLRQELSQYLTEEVV